MAVTLLVKHVSLEQHALPHRQIKALHGEAGQMKWEHTREQVIEHITNQHFHYYFHKDGLAVRLVLDQMPDGELFVKAEIDDGSSHALLQLPPFNPSPSQPLLPPRK